MMRIAIIGAGNMGCLYGANLARAGASVVLVDVWHEHVEQIRTAGLRMEGLHGEFVAKVDAVVEPEAGERADVALVCVNTPSTAAAARTAAALLGPDGYVVTLQNGLGNIEVLEAAVGRGRVLGGLSFHSADLTGPGCVTHTNKGSTYLGEMDRSRSPRLLELADWIERAGMLPSLPEDMPATIWGKFVHNCAINALCALTALRPGQLRDVPEMDGLQTHVVEEALALVRARGIALSDPDPLATIKAYCAQKFHRVSMVQHLERGRATEIDALNGYVVSESRKLGLAAPYNDAVASIIKGIEHGRRHPYA